ncbi:hypothetical protein ACFYXC_25125 [Streptomyces sp. NPDC002701]|uniref:hypothetical protein n=1 Tax=Streptomyces sp. NPDC002701 TaxID=3364661 RepID=UPI003694E0A7
MSPVVVVMLLLAGLSEAAGRVMPLMVRRPGVPRNRVLGLLLAGAAVEGAMFALWPLTAWTLTELLVSTPPDGELVWTPDRLAPLLFAAVLAFPLLGPLLHALLFVGVGTALTGPLATVTGLGWWSAAGCVAVAGVTLGAAAEGVRRLVVRKKPTGRPEVTA